MPVQFQTVQTAWLGQVAYQQAWRLQRRLAAEIAANRQPPTLLLLEHPHTYTLGRAGSWNHLLWSSEEMAARQVDHFEVDRGGDITYHGPGQLVGYPLLPLGQVDAGGRLPGPDYHGYLRRLERLMLAVLSHWELPAGLINGMTGVWLTKRAANGKPIQIPAKIGAIGVKVDANGVSQHGFSLNVQPDMEYFKGIIPCGIEDHPVTSMAQCCRPIPSMTQVRQQVLLRFEQVFDCELEHVEPDHFELATKT